MKTQGKINVENSVGNVDNSLNSRAAGRVYVKQKRVFIDGNEKEKRLKNGAFSTSFDIENSRMSIHKALDIRLVIDFGKKTIDSGEKMWYYNPA